jgi:TetR/AcrR family transcriptional repressor of nem operon
MMSKGEETRERIVAEAAALFNQHGLEGTSMSDLMKATGLEKGGIYRHFSSKEDVAVQAFDYAWQAIVEARMHDVDAVSNSVDKLKRYVANCVDPLLPSVPGGCPLLNTAIDTDDGNPVLRARARKALVEWRIFLESIISTGIKRNEIKQGIKPAHLANIIISCLEGGLMMSRLERNREALLIARYHLEQYLETQVRPSTDGARVRRTK